MNKRGWELIKSWLLLIFWPFVAPVKIFYKGGYEVLFWGIGFFFITFVNFPEKIQLFDSPEHSASAVAVALLFYVLGLGSAKVVNERDGLSVSSAFYSFSAGVINFILFVGLRNILAFAFNAV